jgi:hypothetical protein
MGNAVRSACQPGKAPAFALAGYGAASEASPYSNAFADALSKRKP